MILQKNMEYDYEFLRKYAKKGKFGNWKPLNALWKLQPFPTGKC